MQFFVLAILPVPADAGLCVPEQVLARRAPEAILVQNADRVQPETVIVSDKQVVLAACWYWQRDDLLLLEEPGELEYGLDYAEVPGRRLQLEDLIRRLSDLGREQKLILVADRRRYDRWRADLPAPDFIDARDRFVLAEIHGR